MGRAYRPTITVRARRKASDIKGLRNDVSRQSTPPYHDPPPPGQEKGTTGKHNLGFLPMSIRPPKPNDWNYILDSWKRSFRETLPWVPGEIFYPHMTQTIDLIRADKSSRFRIGCDPEDEDFIFGWSCLGRSNLIHYCFVRHAFRRAHVAKRLTGLSPSAPASITHWTRAAEKINKAYPGLLIFEPSKLPKGRTR